MECNSVPVDCGFSQFVRGFYGLRKHETLLFMLQVDTTVVTEFIWYIHTTLATSSLWWNWWTQSVDSVTPTKRWMILTCSVSSRTVMLKDHSS